MTYSSLSQKPIKSREQDLSNLYKSWPYWKEVTIGNALIVRAVSIFSVMHSGHQIAFFRSSASVMLLTFQQRLMDIYFRSNQKLVFGIL